MTREEVNEQKNRFDLFMKSANLQKIGERMMYFTGHDNDDGKYNGYVYTLRVLRLVAKVQGCMYYPNTNMFYNDIFEREATKIFINSLTENK